MGVLLNPMLGVGIIRLDSCVVNYPLGSDYCGSFDIEHMLPCNADAGEMPAFSMPETRSSAEKTVI